jgi:hypothetical protein
VNRLIQENLDLAEAKWNSLGNNQRQALRVLSRAHGFRIILSDLLLLDGNWYVTHSGLLRLAMRTHCRGIDVQQVPEFCDSASAHWVFKAIVYKSRSSRGFTGYGDANPTNVSPIVQGAEMRVAETRAVNRALRKAYGIGLCSVEELGWEPRSYNPPEPQKPSTLNNNGHQKGHTRLRDRLCLLIRQHQLDANLVKAYAADYCGAPNLRDASRDQIEAFIANLADWATKDRAALLCKLNSYSRSQEVTS